MTVSKNKKTNSGLGPPVKFVSFNSERGLEKDQTLRIFYHNLSKVRLIFLQNITFFDFYFLIL